MEGKKQKHWSGGSPGVALNALPFCALLPSNPLGLQFAFGPITHMADVQGSLKNKAQGTVSQ